MKPSIKIVIAEDHPIFSEGLINALQHLPNYRIVCSVSSNDELPEIIEKYKPDILILDVNLFGKSSLPGIPVLKSIHEHLKIIILSMYMPEDVQWQAFKDDIDAYVLKNSGTEILLKALESLSNNEFFWDPNIKKINHHSDDGFKHRLKLSTRETEILGYLQNGMSNKEIADKLYLSELTVKTHRKNIMQKMNVTKITDLMRKS
jgi:DNA-binding NarL/FixJ family response regulator